MRPLLLLLLSWPLFGATRVHETAIRNPAGQIIQKGSLSICAVASFEDASALVLNQQCASVAITAGTFTVDLSPTLVTTTLSGGINASATAITVASGSHTVNGGYLSVMAEGSNTTENLLVTAGGGTTSLTVARAQLGTAASAHGAAAGVNVTTSWYRVTYSAGAATWSETWLVPDISTVLRRSAVFVGAGSLIAPPWPTGPIGPRGLPGADSTVPGPTGPAGPAGSSSPIDATGLSSGTYCIVVTSGVISGLTLCTGGGGGTTFDSASGMFDGATGLFDAH